MSDNNGAFTVPHFAPITAAQVASSLRELRLDNERIHSVLITRDAVMVQLFPIIRKHDGLPPVAEFAFNSSIVDSMTVGHDKITATFLPITLEVGH